MLSMKLIQNIQILTVRNLVTKKPKTGINTYCSRLIPFLPFAKFILVH
jgi:hypothetical protein